MFTVSRLFITATAVALLIAFSIGGQPSTRADAGEPTDIKSVVDAWGERFAAADKEGWMSYWSDDGVITDIGSKSNVIVGKDALAFIFDTIIAQQLTGKQLSTSVSGDTMTERAEWSDTISDAAGVDRYVVILTTTVRGGKIVRSDLRYDDTDAQTSTYLEYVAAQPNVPFPGSTEFALTGTQPAAAFVAGLNEVTFVEIHRDAINANTLLTSQIRRGDCAADGEVMWELAPVLNGASFTLIGAPSSAIESMASIHITANAGGPDVACGEIPAAAAPATSAPVSAPPALPVTAPNAGDGTGSGTNPYSSIIAVLMVAGAGLVATGRAVSRR